MRVSLRPMALTIFLASSVVAPAFAQQPPSSGAPGQPPANGANGAPAPQPAEPAAVTVYPECKNTPTEAESEAAHGAYLAGKGSFDEADYVTAVTYFRDAYRRDCTKHDLLTALSRAYELKGDRAEAINALETYLRRVPPNAPGNDAIQRRLAALKAQTGSAPTPPPTAAPTSSVTPIPAGPSPQPAAPAPDRGASRHTVYPWIVAGGGGVLLGAGIVFWVVGNGQINDSKEDAKAAGCDGTQCPKSIDTKPFQDKNDSGATKRGIGFALMGVGAAAVAGGIIWHFVEPSVSPSRKIQARPHVAPGYAGLSLGGSF